MSAARADESQGGPASAADPIDAGPIDILLFDIGGVLVDVRRDLARRRWSERTGRPGGSFDEAVFGAGRKDAFDRGALAADAFFAAAAVALGPADPTTDAADLRGALEGAYRTIVQPRPWVPDALGPLRGRYRLALLSNIDPVHHAVFDALPVSRLFDPTAVAVSYRLGARKPDPAAFAGALALLGAPAPARVLFLDDDARNVAAAHAAGLHAAHVPDEASLRAQLRLL